MELAIARGRMAARRISFILSEGWLLALVKEVYMYSEQIETYDVLSIL